MSKIELSEKDLEGVSGGCWHNGVMTDYSSIFDEICCPKCGEYTATYFYRTGPRRCVKILCTNPQCNYLKEDENGI